MQSPFWGYVAAASDDATFHPYYPKRREFLRGQRNTDASAALLAKYQADAAACPNVVFGGRLGEYRYYDMDKVIARALDQVHAWMDKVK